MIFLTAIHQYQPEKLARVELVSSEQTVQPGRPFTVGLHFTITPGWHIYWKNPGDSGQAPAVKWTLPQGWTAGPILWPIPEREKTGQLINYIYEKEILLPVKIMPAKTAASGSQTLKADVSWLVCREVCVPESHVAGAEVEVGAAEVNNPQWSGALESALGSLPSGGSNYRVIASRTAGKITLDLLSAEGLPPNASRAIFFPADDLIDPQLEQKFRAIGGGAEWTLRVSSYYLGKGKKIDGLLVLPKGATWAPLSSSNALPVSAPFGAKEKP